MEAFAIGCNCCGCPKVAADNFASGVGAWEQRVGDWGIVAGNLAIDHDGLIVFDTAVTVGSVIVEVEAKSLNSNVVLSLVAWESDDEHDSGGVEIDFLGTDATLGRLRIESTTGGVTTEIGNTSVSGAGRDSWVTIRACIMRVDGDGDILRVTITTATSTRTLERNIAATSATRIGLRVDGLGAGSGGPSAGLAQFRNFAIVGSSLANDKCEACACDECADSPPYELSIEFVGNYGLLGHPECGKLVAATYILTRLTGCAWSYVAGPDVDGGTLTVQATLTYSGVSPVTRTLTIVYGYSTATGEGSVRFSSSQSETKFNCGAWSALAVSSERFLPDLACQLQSGSDQARVTAL